MTSVATGGPADSRFSSSSTLTMESVLGLKDWATSKPCSRTMTPPQPLGRHTPILTWSNTPCAEAAGSGRIAKSRAAKLMSRIFRERTNAVAMAVEPIPESAPVGVGPKHTKSRGVPQSLERVRLPPRFSAESQENYTENVCGVETRLHPVLRCLRHAGPGGPKPLELGDERQAELANRFRVVGRGLGAGDRDRTGDNLLGRQELYH